MHDACDAAVASLGRAFELEDGFALLGRRATARFLRSAIAKRGLGPWRAFLAFDGDLLHGVHVTRGERWSWVLWLKDRNLPRKWTGEPSESPFGGCAGLTSHWSKKAAVHGDAVSMFLQARRLQDEAEKKAGLLARASSS